MARGSHMTAIMFKARSPLFTALAFVSTLACAATGPVIGPTGLNVDAEISSAALAQDCAGTGSMRRSGDCAAAADGGTGLFGCGFCQQSNMQLALTASAGNGSVRIQVVEVRLLDAITGAQLDVLTSRSPQRWSNNAYAAWDETISAGTMLQVSYALSAADWTRIGGGNSWNTYSRRYRLEVVLRVDGVERTLQSGEITRVPEVVT